MLFTGGSQLYNNSDKLNPIYDFISSPLPGRVVLKASVRSNVSEIKIFQNLIVFSLLGYRELWGNDGNTHDLYQTQAQQKVCWQYLLINAH